MNVDTLSLAAMGQCYVIVIEPFHGFHAAHLAEHEYSVADSINTTTAAGRLVLDVLVSVSQWEREAIGERTADALGHLRAQGVILFSSLFLWDASR